MEIYDEGEEENDILLVLKSEPFSHKEWEIEINQMQYFSSDNSGRNNNNW